LPLVTFKLRPGLLHSIDLHLKIAKRKCEIPVRLFDGGDNIYRTLAKL
jgi:hypothetical protein